MTGASAAVSHIGKRETHEVSGMRDGYSPEKCGVASLASDVSVQIELGRESVTSVAGHHCYGLSVAANCRQCESLRQVQ